MLNRRSGSTSTKGAWAYKKEKPATTYSKGRTVKGGQ